MVFHRKAIVNRKQVLIIASNWRIITRPFQCCWSISQSNHMPVGGSLARGPIKYIYSDIVCICTGMFTLLVNSEHRRWQTWSHTQVDVCQRHSSRLVSANDGRSVTYLVYSIHVFLTYLYDVLRYFTITLPSLLVQSNPCQVDIGFGKGMYIFTCTYRCLAWSGRWSARDRLPRKSGQRPQRTFVRIWQLSHYMFGVYFTDGLSQQINHRPPISIVYFYLP